MKIAWINRSIEAEFARVRDEYPVVTITGPRQSGKTSLAKRYCDGYAYANLESPEIRKLAQSDPKAFFSAYPAPVIIDEVQRVPELLSYIQVFADATSKRGQYILDNFSDTVGKFWLIKPKALSLESLLEDLQYTAA